MENDVEIRYRHLPSEITDDFKKSLEKSDLILKVSHDRKEYFNFTGGPSDILIYINQHLTELLITGLLAPALYDGLKYSLKNTWKKLVQHYKKRNYQIEEDKNCIELNFKLHKDKTIEFNLNGSIDEKAINVTVDKMFEYLTDKPKHDEDLNNPDLLDGHSLKPRIRLQFNSRTNKWEPTNFAKLKKQIEELRRAAKNFEN